MIRVLFVCLGNICRSPLAQGIFEKKIDDAGLAHHFYSDSAGTSGWHQGEKPHSGSIHIAGLRGISIERQRSRPVSISDNQEFDYFIAMDRSNRESLLREFAVPEENLFIVRSFEEDAASANVPDPYGQGEEAFAEVFDILDRSIEGLIRYLLDKHPELRG